MDIVNTFKDNYTKKNHEEQNYMRNEIFEFFRNEANNDLNNEVMNFIISEIKELQQNIFEYDGFLELNNSEKKRVDEIFQKEFDEFKYDFICDKLDYICKIEFEVNFKNFSYTCSYFGCLEDMYVDDIKKYIHYENNIIKNNIEKVVKILFDDYILKEKLCNWAHKYKQFKEFSKEI